MRLVDEDMIDAEFVEDEAVILLLLGQQVFQALDAGDFLLLDLLDEVATCALGAGVLREQFVVFGDLLGTGAWFRANNTPSLPVYSVPAESRKARTRSARA